MPASAARGSPSPTENRKVGGSTPPLATTITAGHRPVTCVFVLLSDRRLLSRPTATHRDYLRWAMSYRTSYRTDLRSESSGRVMSKVLQGCARLVGLGYAPRLRWH